MQLRPFGVSGASLHAKTFVIDDERIFIGSFNFDPRSVALNCEPGFLIDGPTFVESVGGGFDGMVRTLSYRPELTSVGDLIWQEPLGDGKTVTRKE